MRRQLLTSTCPIKHEHDNKRIRCEEMQNVNQTLIKVDWQVLTGDIHCTRMSITKKDPIYACDWVSPLPHQI